MPWREWRSGGAAVRVSRYDDWSAGIWPNGRVVLVIVVRAPPDAETADVAIMARSFGIGHALCQSVCHAETRSLGDAVVVALNVALTGSSL